MARRLWPILAVAMGVAAVARADDDQPTPLRYTRDEVAQPLKLSLEPSDTPSVYALPTPPGPNEGVNAGGINFDVKVSYFTEYMYRGVNRTDFIGDVTKEPGHDRANFQFDGKLSFDLGKLPHPFIGIFTNVLDADPVSNFQEVRPVFGFDWKIRPVIISGGNNTYIFPNRSELGTGEVWGKITLDDSILFKARQPIFSPYIYGAYDYDLYNGWYFEAGISHDFVIEGTGLTLTAVADAAYVMGNESFAGPTGKDTGFQHYEIGLIGKYSLNELLNIPKRYGDWSINGYLYYTDGLSSQLRADTQLYGGGGIELQY